MMAERGWGRRTGGQWFQNILKIALTGSAVRRWGVKKYKEMKITPMCIAQEN